MQLRYLNIIPGPLIAANSAQSDIFAINFSCR